MKKSGNIDGMLFGEVSRLMRRSFERNCAAKSLTQSQAKTLIYLSRNEGIRQVQLAGLLEVQPIVLARQIDQLEKLGIVERRADQEDRRAYRLFLLPGAADSLAEIKQIMEAVRAEAFQGLSEKQLELMFDCMRAIRTNLATSVGLNPAD